MRKFTRFYLFIYIGLTALSSIIVVQSDVFAESSVKTVGKYVKDRFIMGEDDKTLIRYGNWFGPGWWGGSELSDRVGMLPPIDSLDAVAQKHDFGYKVAEELGKGRPDVEAHYKALADAIAARDAMALSDDPSKWPMPAANPELAKTYLNRIRFGFPNFQQKLNEFKSTIPHRADITDLDVLNQMLDGYPDEKKFETLLDAEVKNWKREYNKNQARKENALVSQVDVPKSGKSRAASPEEREARRQEIMKRIQAMNHRKMASVFKALKIDPPAGFYNCLCRKAGYGSSSTSQYYHPDTIGKYDKRYSCNQPGDPCVVSGFGCTRHPLPTKSEIWDGCMNTYRLNMTKTKEGKDDPNSGVRLDTYIEQALGARRKAR